MVCFDPEEWHRVPEYLEGSFMWLCGPFPSTPAPPDCWSPATHCLYPLTFPNHCPEIARHCCLPTGLPALSCVLKCPAVSWPPDPEPGKECGGHAARGSGLTWKLLESGNSRALQSFGKTFDLRGPGWGDQVPFMSGGIEVPVRNWPGREASDSSTLWAEPEWFCLTLSNN